MKAVIYVRYDSGDSISEITKSFNDRGLKTKKGKDFRIAGISLVLKNRKYIGEALFDRVQHHMEANKKSPARKKPKTNIF